MVSLMNDLREKKIAEKRVTKGFSDFVSEEYRISYRIGNYV